MNKLAAIAFLSVYSLQAAILSDNLDATTASTELIFGNTWVAAQVATDSTAYSLDSVTLLLSQVSPGTAELALYASLSGQPDALLTTLSPPSAYSSVLTDTTFAGGGYALSVGSSYWLVLKAVSGEFEWAWTESTSGTGPGYLPSWAVTDDAGVNWFTSNVQPFQLRVEATPVPEPGAGAMVSLPLAALAAFLLRRQWRNRLRRRT